MLTVYVRSWRYTRWQNSLGYPIFFNVDVFVTSCVIPSPVHTKHPRTMIPMECGNSRSKKPWFRWTGVFSMNGGRDKFPTEWKNNNMATQPPTRSGLDPLNPQWDRWEKLRLRPTTTRSKASSRYFVGIWGAGPWPKGQRGRCSSHHPKLRFLCGRTTKHVRIKGKAILNEETNL